ncbi:MAG: hypothetical protein Q4C73_04790 [Eubacteriales bacterium]|nr:hypothetical protein [Eubacteriales bacterium]
MANYLTGVRRERTALLEWNGHGAIEAMARFCRTKVCGPEGACFQKSRKAEARTAGNGKTAGDGLPCPDARILEVDYYGRAGARALAGCLNGGYRRIIVDYGEITDTGMYECARCDLKIVVGALSEWQAGAFLELMQREPVRDRSWIYAAAFGSGEARREWEKAFGRPCIRIPASVDAFAVTRADMEFFRTLLF